MKERKQCIIVKSIGDELQLSRESYFKYLNDLAFDYSEVRGSAMDGDFWNKIMIKTNKQSILDSEIYTVALAKLIDYLDFYPKLPKDIEKINFFLFNSQFHFIELPCNMDVSYKMSKIDYDMLKSDKYVTLKENGTTFILCKHYDFIQMRTPNSKNINEMNNHFINNLTKGNMITRSRLSQEASSIVQMDKSDIKPDSKWLSIDLSQVVSIHKVEFEEKGGVNLVHFIDIKKPGVDIYRDEIAFRNQYRKIR